MIRQFIAQHLGFHLQDVVRGTDILKTLKFLRNSQFWDETRVYEYQMNKLKKLIDYASKNVPYYEQLFKKIKLSSTDIQTLDDIGKIPILSKETFRMENMNLISRTFDKKYVKIGKTGGTTGPPVIVYKDVYTRSFTWASYYRWYEWMNLNYFDRTATFWGTGTVLSKSQIQKLIDNISMFIQNNVVLGSFQMNEEKMKSLYKVIKHFNPILLKGYLSALINLAQYINDNNLEPIIPKAISSTTETLLPHNRIFLENIFKAPIYDQYGCGEVSAISYECSHHNGLHINQEHVILEVLNEIDEPLINHTGRVIATDLDNLVMPIIRFENGDLAALSDKKCACNINQPLMKSIEGRSIDTIVLKNGSKVHGVFFTDIFFELGITAHDIQKFQVFQEKVGEIEFRIETNSIALKNKIQTNLLNALNRFFDKVIIKELKNLHHEENGKFKYIISNLE